MCVCEHAGLAGAACSPEYLPSVAVSMGDALILCLLWMLCGLAAAPTSGVDAAAGEAVRAIVVTGTVLLVQSLAWTFSGTCQQGASVSSAATGSVKVHRPPCCRSQFPHEPLRGEKIFRQIVARHAAFGLVLLALADKAVGGAGRAHQLFLASAILGAIVAQVALRHRAVRSRSTSQKLAVATAAFCLPLGAVAGVMKWML
jgi:hypothetical protein